MPTIDRSSLMVAIQAVEIALEHYEHIQDATAIGHRLDDDDFLVTLETTKAKLRNAYLKERELDSGLLSYEQLVGQEPHSQN